MQTRATLLLIGLATTISAMAQCTFTPTISPNTLILCPEETATLMTEPYDAYQWYKDGSLIDGAVDQALPVSAMLDVGSMFTVEATLDGCTEMSAGVLVDGWMFLPPYVIHGGDEPISSGPELLFCEGDTLLLELGPGYTESIVWTNNGAPIPNETSPILVVTTPGSYTVSAATGTCPNYVLNLGVTVDVAFTVPMQPDIVDLGTEICPYPVGISTYWYLNDQPYSSDECITPTEPGAYSVFVDYGQACQAISDPWLTTGTGALTARSPSASPIPTRDELRVQWPAGSGAQPMWRLLDATGREVLSGTVPATGTSILDVRAVPAGNYVLVASGMNWKPLQVVIVAQ